MRERSSPQIRYLHPGARSAALNRIWPAAVNRICNMRLTAGLGRFAAALAAPGLVSEDSAREPVALNPHRMWHDGTWPGRSWLLPPVVAAGAPLKGMSSVTSMSPSCFRLCRPRKCRAGRMSSGDCSPLGFAEPTGRRCQAGPRWQFRVGELGLCQAPHDRAGCGRGPGELA
jgi:hypothetical protein